jgi:hypothetical protein
VVHWRRAGRSGTMPFMEFVHLVQINDPRTPGIEPLTREQLWQGLVARAERPAHFLIGMDECRILGRGENTLERQLRFGSLVVRDRVVFVPGVAVRYEIEATAQVPGGSLVMQIEEPQPEQLFVRFEYRLEVGESRAEAYLSEFRKSAYREADIDTVWMIRQLAASRVV